MMDGEVLVSHRWLASLLVAWLLACLPLAARAAGRIVLTSSEPCTVYLDDQPAVDAMAGMRAVLASVPAGVHALALRTATGEVLFDGRVEVPDGVQVTATFDRGAGLVITSEQGRLLSGEAAPEEPVDYGPGGRPPEPEVTTFDMNEGRPIPARTTPSSRTAGNYEAFSSTVSTAGRVAGTATQVATPGVATTVSVATGAARVASSTLRNAEAGGTSALGRGSRSSTFRQGRPIPPKAVTGFVEFQVDPPHAYVVYLEGFVIAELGPGRPSQKVKLEVGRHHIEIWDPDLAQPVYKGVLMIEKDYTLALRFGPDAPPEAPDRPWMWSAR